MRQLSQVNLNLLVSLKALLETGSTTLAAERLGLTQPTMSRHVAQLRELFDDPLIVRAGSRHAPTPRAIELSEALGPALLHLEKLLQLESDPATAPREFFIAAPDVVATYVLGDVLAGLLGSADNFTITLLNWDIGAMKRLKEGEIDLAVSIDDLFSPNIFRAQIGEDRWVCLMRTGHPLAEAGRELTLEDILAHRHARARTGGGRDKLVETYLQRRGVQRDIRVTTDGYLPLCSLLSRTDLIAIVPWHQARMDSQLFPLTFAPLALDLPNVIYSIWWHERFQHDRAHKRLRELILPAIRDHPAHAGIFGRRP